MKTSLLSLTWSQKAEKISSALANAVTNDYYSCSDIYIHIYIQSSCHLATQKGADI